MKTLLKDTLETLKFNGLSENDVEWAGMDKIWFSWEEFKLLADLIYDGLLLFTHDEEIKAIREKWQRKEINDVGLFHELEKLSKVESLPE